MPSRAPAARTLALAALAALAGCPQDDIIVTGEFGRAIPQAFGDASPLPRLLFRPGGCGDAPGGCASVCAGAPADCPADACLPIVVDSGSPVTRLPGDGPAQAVRTCFEVRSGGDVLGDMPAGTAIEAARTRFRFDSTPAVRLPGTAADVAWGWQVGDESAAPFVGAVLGGNVLRELAVRFTAGDPPTLTLYREFPGDEASLADQGSAALPLQFPGLLLGKLIDDVCAGPNGDSCDFTSLGVFDREHPESLIQSTRMVVDACLGPPPAAAILDPARPGRCALSSGPGKNPANYRSPTGGKAAQVGTACNVADVELAPGDLDRGHEASLVIATGLPGLVLFADSALRMFGTLDLPACHGDGGLSSGDALRAPACLEGQAGLLRAAGWPPAGSAERPLVQLRVRSVALLPGLAQSTGAPACQRLEQRLRAVRSQCDYAVAERIPRDVAAAASCRGHAATTAAVVGQAFVASGRSVNPDLWIPTLVVPEDHPLVTSLRRDVSPEALQPDGMLGTALLAGTDVVLDYTDPTPSVRVACVDPDDGTCLALPSCVPGAAETVVPACCFGLPEDLLVALIRDEGAYGCCAALSPATIEELNLAAETMGREPPCP